MKMEQSVPKLRHKIQKPGNHPKERTQHSEHVKSLKSGLITFVMSVCPHGTTRLPLDGFL